MKKSIILLITCIFSVQCFSDDPVIINDQGNWSGEIVAAEEGFLTYVAAMWTQNGDNTGSELILSFADDYSPNVTAEGDNTVTCTYDEVGWIWPYGGPTVTASISFKTSKQIISVGPQLGGTWLVDSKEVGKDVVPLDNNGNTQTVLYGPEIFDITTTRPLTGSSAALSAFSWTVGTACTAAAFIPFLTIPAAVTGVAVTSLCQYLQLTLPTSEQVTVQRLVSNTASISSGYIPTLKITEQHQRWYFNVQIYPDANKDGLADSSAQAATINHNGAPSYAIQLYGKDATPAS